MLTVCYLTERYSMKSIRLSILLSLGSIPLCAKWPDACNVFNMSCPALFQPITWSIPINIPTQHLEISNIAIQPIKVTLQSTQIHVPLATLWVPTKFTVSCCFIAAIAWYVVYKYQANVKKRALQEK